MSIFDYFKKKSVKKPKQQRAKKVAVETPKELATAKGEPWVAVLTTNINPANPKNGFFELDWNDYFVVSLRHNGYKGDTDEEVVERWFRELCVSIAAEDQEILDSLVEKAVQSEDGTDNNGYI